MPRSRGPRSSTRRRSHSCPAASVKITSGNGACWPCSVVILFPYSRQGSSSDGLSCRASWASGDELVPEPRCFTAFGMTPLVVAPSKRLEDIGPLRYATVSISDEVIGFRQTCDGSGGVEPARHIARQIGEIFETHRDANHVAVGPRPDQCAGIAETDGDGAE